MKTKAEINFDRRRRYALKRTEFTILEFLDISDGTINALEAAGICSVAAIMGCEASDLLRIPRIGRFRFSKIRTALAKFGLTLRGDEK